MNLICEKRFVNYRHAILTAITPGVTLLSKSSHACGLKSKSYLLF